MFKRVVAGLMVVGMAGAVGCAADAQEEESFTTAALEQGLDCHTNNGIHPMKAALAVAMATEIGRLDPVNDLFVANDFVKLSDQARALCSSRGFESCPNTEAILGMQNALVNQEVDQSVFNATSFRHDLVASFDRQRNHERNLEMNDPSRVPGRSAPVITAPAGSTMISRPAVSGSTTSSSGWSSSVATTTPSSTIAPPPTR